jgi:solute carrier family 35, member E3
VVGHLKTCSIVTLGWIATGRKASDMGLLGALAAIMGIISYTIIMYRYKQRQGLKA